MKDKETSWWASLDFWIIFQHDRITKYLTLWVFGPKSSGDPLIGTVHSGVPQRTVSLKGFFSVCIHTADNAEVMQARLEQLAHISSWKIC